MKYMYSCYFWLTNGWLLIKDQCPGNKNTKLKIFSLSPRTLVLLTYYE